MSGSYNLFKNTAVTLFYFPYLQEDFRKLYFSSSIFLFHQTVVLIYHYVLLMDDFMKCEL